MRYFAAAFSVFLLSLHAAPPLADGKREMLKGLDGRPMTFVHAADSERILRVEDADSVSEFLYDAGGRETGITIRPVGTNLALTVRMERDGLSTDAMPQVNRLSTDEGRHSSIRTSGGEEIASYTYHSGYVSEVTVGDRMKLELSQPKDNRVAQTLRGARGQKIRDAVAPGRDGRLLLPLDLDVVGAELGLGDGWRRTITLHTSASNNLTTVTDSSGKVILYAVNLGLDRVAFDATGRPLFYDLAISVGKHTSVGNSDAVDDAPSTDLASVVPDHVVLSHTGMTGAYVYRESAGAINSFWTERDASGQVVIKSRTAELDASTR
jgi:hypothetical protein